MSAALETSKSTERVTARVSPENRALLEQAAMISGATNLNSFLTNVVINEARRIIAEQEVLQLGKEDAIAFVEALDAPVKINQNLLKAAVRYKEIVQDADTATE